jgi:uncharacterized membrane protein (UPF0182 family)
VPLLQKVLAWYNNSVGYADTLGCALDQVANGRPAGSTNSPACAGDTGASSTTPSGSGQGGTATPTPSASASSGPSATTAPTGTAQQQLQQALADASAAYQAGQDALKRGDFAQYGVEQKRLGDALARAQRLEQQLAAGGASAAPSRSPSAKPSPTG